MFQLRRTEIWRIQWRILETVQAGIRIEDADGFDIIVPLINFELLATPDLPRLANLSPHAVDDPLPAEIGTGKHLFIILINREI